MPRFFDADINGATYILTGENGRHAAKSLRMKEGEKLVVCDGKATDYHAEIDKIDGENVHINITEVLQNKSEPKVRVHLLQCIPKSDKMDYIVQKAVELGVYDITPVASSRCVSQIDGKEKKKIQRWNKISLEASKQSSRGIVPQVLNPVSYKEALKKSLGDKLFFYEAGGQKFCDFLEKSQAEDITILIGPEGGFSSEEAELAEQNGFEIISLGQRILRTETASLCALSIIMYEKDS